MYQIYWSSLMIYCEYLSFLDLVQNDIKVWLIIQCSFFSKFRNCLKDTSNSAHVFKWPTYNWNWSVSTLKVKHLETYKIEQQHVTPPSPLLPSPPHPIVNLSGTRTPSAPSFNHRHSAALCTPAVHVAVHLAYIDFCSSAESAQLFLYWRKVIPPLHQQSQM